MARGEALPLPGVGKRIGKKLAELIATGRLAFYEDLLEDQPEHIRALMAVDGIGPKIAQRLYAGLGVGTVGDLIAATERKHVQTTLRLRRGARGESGAGCPRRGRPARARGMTMDDGDDVDLDDTDPIEPREVLAPLAGREYGFPDLPLSQPEHALDLPLTLSLHPRPYQREAVQRWLDAEGRGVVVLPTGRAKRSSP